MNIDLTRHAVIEASAGTGKTYTIENLVLRLLTETDTPLEKILLVTFTEKATGDLKARLKAALERSVRDDADRRALLRPALDHFDQAPIFTIHGFCQRLLQEYALEQGQDFRAALVDDSELLPPGLRDLQRRLWRAHFGDKLRDVLEKAGYCRDTAGDWDGKVREVATRYHPRSDHQLRPAPVDDWWQRLDEPVADWNGQLEVFTVQALREYLRDYKRQRGLQSFDDMIATVEESLDPIRNPDAEAFAARLRERYHFGIVDEFQDTDPLQWRIFRRIFLDAGASRLFVVGDPKQAIFGFRGADLPTYLKAAKEMEEQHNACRHDLQTNWRSAPELLDALNCVFGDGDWFPKESGIRCPPVHAPKPDEQQTRIADDRTDRPALTVVDMRAQTTLKLARKHFARFVAGEVQRLLRGTHAGPALTFVHKKSEPRALQPGDICILVQKRAEAEPIAEALTDLGIPFAFHKQGGFWQSEEVLQLETLLRCLARPEERSSFRKALLTCFFRIAPAELVKNQDLPARHPARLLFQKWLAHAEARQWSALFQSVLEDTGILLHEPDDAAAEARLANLRHLMTTLERVGHGESRDLLGLLDWMRRRRDSREPGEADLQPVETQRPKVKIMTIHASKGLEFPVVFLAGGFTFWRPPGSIVTYRDDEGRKVFDFRSDNVAQQKQDQETDSESRRLMYVALTRPMFKLYVPLVQVGSRAKQWAGPAGTVLMPALKQACPEKLGPLVCEIVAPPPLRTPIVADAEEEPAPAPERPPLVIAGPLFPMPDGHLDRRRIVVRSFSGMSKHHVAMVGEGHSYGDRPRPTGDEIEAAPDRDDPLRGAAFGDIVHNVLETINFAEVGHTTRPAELLLSGAPSRLVIEKEVKANVGKLRGRSPADLEQAALDRVAELVWNALHTPLSAAGGSLWQVPPGDRLHELEFQYPEHPGEMVPAEVRREDGFLMGYMDLVFRTSGRYFLADWKTNLLTGYSPDHLARCMDECDYHRQYRLYLHALERWLARVHGKRFSFLEQFGGVYYLFVRGLNGRDETGGVFFHQPTREDLELERAMAR